MTILRKSCLTVSLVGLCFFGAIKSASAQMVPTDVDLAAARRLAEAGSVDYKKGDYAAALTKLERAYDLVKVPKLGLWYARSLAKNGKLVEAAERYAEVTRLEATGPKAAEQKVSQAEATTEREQLLRRIARLTITIEGVPSSAVQLTVDGLAMASSLIGKARHINPGKHLIQAKHQDEVVEKELTIGEGERLAIALQLSPTEDTNALVPLANPEPPPVQPTLPANEPFAATNKPKLAPSEHGTLQRTAGWVAVGIGGAGLVVGTVTGILVLSKKSQLEDSGDCPDHKCTLGTQHDTVTSYNALRTVSAASFVIGTIGAATGVSLLLTAPKRSMEPSITAWLGPAAAGVRGRF